MFPLENDPIDGAGGSGIMVAGHASGLLIPVRFFWPYGGRRVFLVGSFTRWAEHIPMSPLEGCPTVFQVVWSLIPGIHEYKFFVDGEWRHDERQPCAKSEFGIVNTLLAEEPISIPAISSPGIPTYRMNMDVDTEEFHHVGTSLRTSEVDVSISRNRISVFLSSHTAYELLPVSGKVIALDIHLPVKQAFHVLYEQGVPIAPLLDTDDREFVGVLSPLDFILIMRELGSHGSNLTEEELETHSIFAWKQVKHQLNRQTVLPGGAYQSRLVHAGPRDSLKDVAYKILENQVSAVPIIYSTSQDGSFPQLLHLATLSGILKCICRYFGHSSVSLPILQQSISSIRLGTWVPGVGESTGKPLAMLRANAPLSSALSLLLQAGVSSIPIVDDHDCIVDTYSRSDITALAKDKAYARLHLDDMSINQALQLAQDVNSPSPLFDNQRCQMCLRSDSLQKVMERLTNPGVRRVIVVEAGSKRVEGIISISDVLRYLLGLPQGSER